VSRWRPRHLILSWLAWWAALAGVSLGPLILAVVKASDAPDGHSSMSAGFSNLVLNASVVVDGATTYAGSAHLVAIALWIAVPPLALWAGWLAGNSAAERAQVGGPGAAHGKPRAVGELRDQSPLALPAEARHVVEVHDMRAVDSHEARRVEPGLDSVE
jgi:hypothetical protein